MIPDRVTIGEKYNPAMVVTTKEEAMAYLEECVLHTLRVNKDLTREDAVRQELSNIGYYAGYYNSKTITRVYKLFNTTHPIFGKTIPTPKEALEARKLRSGFNNKK